VDKNKSRKLKVHLVFGSALTLALLVSVISRMTSGERLLQASWNAFREIRPVELAMIFLFWYAAAFPRSEDEGSSNSMTTLGLSQKQ
jgi:cell division protein FtsW (lipid II flippase)